MAQSLLTVKHNITLSWSGKDPLVLPDGGMLQPGETTLSMDVWHSLGGDPVLNDHIAHGRLRPVHRAHEFQPGDNTCIGCSLTRKQVDAERERVGQEKKAEARKAQGGGTPPAPPAAAT